MQILPLFQVLEEVFPKEFTNKRLTSFFERNKATSKWMVYSDYCIGDSGKPNDVVTYSVIPFFVDFQVMQNVIQNLAPKDLKNTRSVNEDFLVFMRDAPIINISFVLNKHRIFTQKKDRETQREVLLSGLEQYRELLNNWCKTTPEGRSNYLKVLKKISKLKAEMQRKSFNIGLMNDILIVSNLGSYIATIIANYSSPEIIGWFSDRDKILSTHEGIINDIYDTSFYLLRKHYGINNEGFKSAIGVPKEDPENPGKMWYDEAIKIPDYISGTLADWDTETNYCSKDKFIPIIEKYIAENDNMLIFRLTIDGGFQCASVECGLK